MQKASAKCYIAKKSKRSVESEQFLPAARLYGGLTNPVEADLNVVVLSFNTMKEAQKNIAGGDAYSCKKCGAILNKYSVVKSAVEAEENKAELKPNESLWNCEFCSYPNVIMIEKEEIPVKDDVVYMLESALEQGETDLDSTVIFCVDISGSMNSTSEIKGKVDLKFGLSQEEIDMLKQFMEPGDEAQFNFLPGAHNKDKTFISRKQCVLSAIESQIQQIRKTDPHKKVGFILFNNEVVIVGDGKAESVHIVGDKLNNVSNIVDALNHFKLTTTLEENFDVLLNRLNKTEAKGQTALGPALVSAIEVASKGSKGSVVVLCTDGLANIGVGSMEGPDQAKYQFYDEVAQKAKEKNVSVNIVTIKGQSSKLQILSKVVEATNGNVKVVNPQKLSDDFANILKDEVVGLNVQTRIMLHKALVFRNQDPLILKDNKTMLVKNYANATTQTKMSFEYEVREEEDLKFLEIDIEKLKKVPFQSQIIYYSPKGGKFLRVISSESETTMEKKELEKEANIGVVHQRIASNTAAMYSRGDIAQSAGYNSAWSGYLNDNFKAPEYQHKQEAFNNRNRRMNEAISNKVKKQEKCMKPEMNVVEEQMDIEEPVSKLEKAQFGLKEEKQGGGGVKGFFASLLGGSAQKKQVIPEKAPMKRARKSSLKKSAMKEQVVHMKEEKPAEDSDEDEMQIKNYMMGKNDLFD